MKGLAEHGSTGFFCGRDKSVLKILKVIQHRFVAIPEFQEQMSP
jgi:hypothetical protein